MLDSFEKYKDYSVSQFVLDDRFIDWIKTPTVELNTFWEGFLKESPEQAEKVWLAKKMVAGFRTVKDPVDDAVKDRLWSSINKQATKPAAPVVQMRSRRWWIAAAAAVAVLAVSGAFLKLSANKQNEIIQTAFGEKRTLTLPDNSMVVLNAASKIEYSKEWTKDAPREVWVDGEAFFDVVHKNKAGTKVQPSERFIVHLKNMDVEVLGTTFTVNTRRNEEQVVLQTGSVKVALKDKKEVILKPGEMLRLTAGADSVKKVETNPVEHSSWKNNQLTFNNTSLGEIAKLIEDNYGYKVVVQDTSILNKTISGTLSSENEQILFKALETMLDVNLSVQNKTVTISKK